MDRRVREQVLGEDRPHRWTIRDELGNVESGFTEANPLSAAIWRGDALSPLATPAMAWLDPAAGKVECLVTRADTAGLEAGTYQFQAFVDDDAGRHCILDVDLKLLASAGSGTPPKVYCTADQMAVFYPGLGKIRGETDETGFAEQLSKARDEINRLVLKCWDGRKSDAEVSRWADYRCGLPAEIVLGSYSGPPSARDLPWLRGVLDADGLIVTEEVAELAALKALVIVLEAEVAETAIVAAGRDSGYQQLADRFAARADRLIRDLVAEIDADGDGVADLTVDCRNRALIR